jgi:putative ATP-grasp target RiPP
MSNTTHPQEAACISPAAHRFALGSARPRPRPDGDRQQPAQVFGQRFFATAGELSQLVFPAYRYCPERQLAVTEDGEPLIRRLVGWDKTTTGSSDSKDKLQEEWTMDFLR